MAVLGMGSSWLLGTNWSFLHLKLAFYHTMYATLHELSGLNFCSPARESHLKFQTKAPVSLRWDALIASAGFISLSH